jgi:hypothetical protein
MPVINKKNVLNLGPVAQRRWWDDIRHKPELERRFTAGDLLSWIPGGRQVGGVVSLLLRFSVSVQGVVEFLIGDDPGVRYSDAELAAIADANSINPFSH